MESFMNDVVTLVKKDGNKYENIKASVQNNKIFTTDDKLPIEEGDIFIRKLPNGLDEEFVVDDRGFFPGRGGIHAHYQVKVSRKNKQKVNPTSATYNLHGPNSRVNVNSQDFSINTVEINKDNVFQELCKIISKQISDANEKQLLIDKIKELESIKNTDNYTLKYTEFIAHAANHISIIAPFIPMLTAYLIK